MNLAPLRPDWIGYGCLRPPSRLKMNSLRSALTAVLAGLKTGHYRGKGELKNLCQERKTQTTETALTQNT